jgi:sulfatase maturation enzyme AslB (radical SAM superfamily)
MVSQTLSMSGPPNSKADGSGGKLSSSPHLAVRALLRHSTPKKLFNLALAQVEKKTRPLHARSRPYQVSIDLSNACSLRCPYCPTGAVELDPNRKLGFVDPEHVAALMDRVGPYAYIAYLYSWGEPLMHPKVAEIVSLVSSHNVLTDISTHFNLKNTAVLEAVLDAGLNHLKLSIDGATQAVYEQYRVRGRLDTVLENARHVVAYKRARKLRNLTIEWQFVVFDHNRHEIDAARQLAAKLGVDVFRTMPGTVPDETAVEAEHPQAAESAIPPFLRRRYGDERQTGQSQGNVQQKKTVEGCPFLYDMIAMQVDGGIVPCCNLYDKIDDFTDGPTADLGALWNGPTFVMARKLFRKDLVNELPSDLDHPCLACPVAHAQPHLSHLVVASPTRAMAVRRPAKAAATAPKTVAVSSPMV